MKSLETIITAAAFGLIAGVVMLAVSQGPYLARAQGTGLGPTGTTVALNGGTPVQIVGQNPTRKGLVFCNPTAVVEFVAPAGTIVLSTSAVGIGLPAIASGVTSCFTVPGSGLGNVIGNLGSAWNGSSASATPNITVLEYY
jgi:hypothetical protein